MSNRLRAALIGLIGVESAEELRQMEAMIRLTAAPDADKAAMLNAIHALLDIDPDEALLRRCYTWLEANATGGALLEDLRERLCV